MGIEMDRGLGYSVAPVTRFPPGRSNRNNQDVLPSFLMHIDYFKGKFLENKTAKALVIRLLLPSLRVFTYLGNTAANFKAKLSGQCYRHIISKPGECLEILSFRLWRKTMREAGFHGAIVRALSATVSPGTSATSPEIICS